MNPSARRKRVWSYSPVKFGGLLIALAAGVSVFPSAVAPAGNRPPAVAFCNVHVFDGEKEIGKTTVLVRGNRIAAVGAKVVVPADAAIIDGAGKTLLPGLIDAHTHVFGDGAEKALQFGVTTQIDMFTDYRLMQEFHRRQSAGANPDRADLVSCGTLATAPGGHGTEYGLAIPTLSTPSEAQAFIDARVKEGSDFIKIIYGHMAKLPALDKPTLAALVAAAHRRGKLAAVHVWSLADAGDAIECGADILAHAWGDREPEEALMALARRSRVVLVPTLTAVSSTCGLKPGAALMEDPRFAPLFSQSDLTYLRWELPGLAEEAENFKRAQRISLMFKRAGMIVLAGTDSLNPGTAYGASLHQELGFLVQAGFSPAEALGAATALPARVFGLADRGRIAAGRRADLLLVEGNPLVDIRNTRRIAGIWKEGVALDCAAYREKIARENAEAASRPKPALPAGLDADLISDFEDGTSASRFGSGWQGSTDSIMGGRSTVELEIASTGANGSRHSLSVTGDVVPGPAFAWSGVILFPASQPFAPADLSAKKAITFWAKGDGQTYRILFYSQKTGFFPAMRPFVAGPEWRQFRFAFGDFSRMDSALVTAIAFSAGPTAGPFGFQLDDIALE